MASIGGFIYSQLVTSLPLPSVSYEGKTVIITGSNVGLGKEAARHFARLGVSKLILAVRNEEKGNEAKRDIENTTRCAKDVVQVWKLDMASYASVKKFGERVEKELERLDIAICNAGIATDKYSKAEENESTITVNVVSTFLLALLLLPKLKKTAKEYKIRPNLTIVSSEVHFWSTFKERSAPEGEIFNTISDEATADMKERYFLSKLLEVLVVRAIAERHPSTSFPVTINYVNPGLCHSELARDGGWFLFFMKLALARKTEYGSRTLVHAASQGSESHGQYLSDCQITPPSGLVRSEDGKKAQDRVYNELIKKLETISPGISKNL